MGGHSAVLRKEFGKCGLSGKTDKQRDVSNWHLAVGEHGFRHVQALLRDQILRGLPAFLNTDAAKILYGKMDVLGNVCHANIFGIMQIDKGHHVREILIGANVADRLRGGIDDLRHCHDAIERRKHEQLQIQIRIRTVNSIQKDLVDLFRVLKSGDAGQLGEVQQIDLIFQLGARKGDPAKGHGLSAVLNNGVLLVLGRDEKLSCGNGLSVKAPAPVEHEMNDITVNFPLVGVVLLPGFFIAEGGDIKALGLAVHIVNAVGIIAASAMIPLHGGVQIFSFDFIAERVVV